MEHEQTCKLRQSTLRNKNGCSVLFRFIQEYDLLHPFQTVSCFFSRSTFCYIYTIPYSRTTTKMAIHYGRRPLCRVPGAHGKAPKAHGKPFAVCRTRQPGIGKAGLCRVLYIGHTAKGLPCATLDPRQNKVASQER